MRNLLIKQFKKPGNSKASMKLKLNSWMYLRWKEQYRQDVEAGQSSMFGEEKQFSLANHNGQYLEIPY